MEWNRGYVHETRGYAHETSDKNIIAIVSENKQRNKNVNITTQKNKILYRSVIEAKYRKH